jgi:hypothetical protein
MSALRKNVASQVLTFSLVSASTGAALTGATVTVKATLDGTQSAGAGTVTELGSGQYKYAPTQGETNGTSFGFLFTATGAIPVNIGGFTTAADPTDAVRMGLTALPNANAEAAGGLFTRGTGAGQINQDANGRADINVAAISGSTNGVASLQRSANTIVRGTCDTGGTTTSIPTSSLSPAAGITDQFKGRVVIFDANTSTANLRGVATDITGSSSGGTLTVSALPTAAASGDTFAIV